MQRALVLAGVCLLVLFDLARHDAVPPSARAVIPASPVAQGGAKLVLKSRGHLPMPPDTPAAHASNLLAMPADHQCALMAFWFAGERESAPDVQIASSCFERASQQWRAAAFVVNRYDIGEKLGYGIRRLGNPVAWLDASQRIHLFVVATGPGGWAASRLLHVRQNNSVADVDAPLFGEPRVLPLSWWWNVSHLVRGAPLDLEDGGMVLPAYFELGTKYPLALRFDRTGAFKGMTRMSDRRAILQPTLIALNPTHWLALMRDNRLEGKIAVAQSGDGGLSWRDLRDLSLSNPDASVSATMLGPWHFMMAHNSSPKSRQVLDLSESENGIDWTRVLTLAQGGVLRDGAKTKAAEFSYPALLWADGSLWVMYTENRTRIAWQRFVMEKSP
jgi:predicted neuraminidase